MPGMGISAGVLSIPYQPKIYQAIAAPSGWELEENMLWGPALAPFFATNGGSAPYIDAAGEMAWVRFSVLEDCTLDTIMVTIYSITGNPPAYKVGFCAGLATGRPDTATLFGGCAWEDYDFTVTGMHEITLTTPAVAVRGDHIWAVLTTSTTPPDAGNRIRLLGCESATGGYTFSADNFYGTLVPCGAYYEGTSHWPNYQMIGVRNAIGETIVPILHNSISISPTYQSDTDPDEMGAVFSLPFNATVEGAGGTMQIGYDSFPANPIMRIYSAADVVLATHVCHSSEATTYNRVYRLWNFDDPVDLEANTTYRVTWTSDSATNNMEFHRCVGNGVADREWYAWGDDWQGTQRVDAGAWTDQPTQLPGVFLILSKIWEAT